MDNYTKIILTVIAVSMFKIAFFEIKAIENAYADNKVHKIALCDVHGNCSTMRQATSGTKAIAISNIGH